MTLEKQILQELIYERIRLSVNLCQLVIFEQDLDKSINRAIARCDNNAETQQGLTRKYVEQAWERIEQEWHDMRERLSDLDDLDTP